MPNQEAKPKRPRKSKKVKVDRREQWKLILKDVDKDQVPINFLDSIELNLIDGTNVIIDVKHEIDSGMDPDILHQNITQKLTELDHMITDVDFFISIEKVDAIVQPITNEILKDL